MKNVLFITYYFPPIAGAGVYRSMKFVKYLTQFGWNPIVLTIKNSFNNPKDKSLLNEVKDDFIVYKAISGQNPIWSYSLGILGINSKWIHIPDDILLWKSSAFHRVKKILKDYKINVVYTTSPPETVLILGLKIKKKYKLPWVIDYRDPWTERCDYPTKYHKEYEVKKEREISLLADYIVLNTDVNKKSYVNTFNISEHKCATIYNGFDPEDFDDINVKDRNKNKFAITYSGIYRKSYAPESFLLALLEIVRKNKSFTDKAAFYKTGVNRWPYYKKLMKELSNFMEVRDAGHISYKESIKILKESDLLVLTLPSDDPNSNLHYDDERDVNGWVPSKLYNYLAAKQSILAIVPSSSTLAQIMRKTNTGKVVTPDDHNSIVDAILEFFSSWEKKINHYQPVEDEIEKYNRINQTQTLASIFDKLVN